MSISRAIKPVFVHQVQTRLTDFYHPLSKFKRVARARLFPRKVSDEKREALQRLALDSKNVVCLESPYCPHCLKPLSKWGTNPRKMIFDHGQVPNIAGVQRYRCPTHGEINANLNRLVPPRSRYAENWRKRACQLVYDGNTPAAVRRIFMKCYGASPSESLIRNWAAAAGNAASAALDSGNVPTSGYFGQDEIHASLRGERVYIQTMIDLETSFCPGLGYTIELSDTSIRNYWHRINMKKSSIIEGLVLDGSSNYDKVLELPEFSRVEVQLCQAHYKKGITEKLYIMAGLGHSLSEPLPDPFPYYKRLLFATFRRRSRVNAEFTLAYADLTLRGKESTDIDRLLDGISKKSDKLFQYLLSPRLQRTNNKDEKFNNKLERYRNLKKGMQTPRGIKRVADTIAFLHNYELFPDYIAQVESRTKEARARIKEEPSDKE